MDYTVGDTLYFKFSTRSFSTGAPTTLAGTPVISAYEDDSLTQITAGITLTADFDSVTGLNHVTVVATGANGFEAGKQYDLVITTGTVGGVSVVGEVVATFSLEAEAAFTRLGAPAGASIAADIATVDGVVDSILVDTAEIGAAGAGLTAIPWNAAWDAEVESEANDALVAIHLDHLLAADYDPAAKPGVATALLNELVESDAGVSRFTVNALEQVWGAAVRSLTVTDMNLVTWLGVAPNALIAGRVDANAQVIGTDAIDSAAVAASAVDEFWDEVFAELSQAAPPATPTGRQAIMALYMALRNKLDVDSSFKEIHNDAGTVIFKKALSDDGTTYSEAEAVTGP